MLTSGHGETLSAAVATLRNLSIHRANEPAIVEQRLLPDLTAVLARGTNPTAQLHAAGTLRNLAAGDHVKVGGGERGEERGWRRGREGGGGGIVDVVERESGGSGRCLST